MLGLSHASFRKRPAVPDLKGLFLFIPRFDNFVLVAGEEVPLERERSSAVGCQHKSAELSSCLSRFIDICDAGQIGPAPCVAASLRDTGIYLLGNLGMEDAREVLFNIVIKCCHMWFNCWVWGSLLAVLKRSLSNMAA